MKGEHGKKWRKHLVMGIIFFSTFIAFFIFGTHLAQIPTNVLSFLVRMKEFALMETTPFLVSVLMAGLGLRVKVS